MLAHDLMTADPAVITAGDTLAAAAHLMRVRDAGLLPVIASGGDRRLVGVITDRDIVVRAVALGHGASAKVHEHMTRMPLVTVTPLTSIRDVTTKMMRHKVRRLPVVDGQGRVVGIIAQADLATQLGPDHPELVEHVLEAISRPGVLVHETVPAR